MSETAAKPGLVRKLAEVMGEVERIPKSGHNSFHNYDYATEADIVAAVRAGLAKRSVFLTHKVDSLAWRMVQTKGGECPVATVHVTFTANDGDTGEVLDLAATVGEGQDAGDKAVYKALTGALKYALLKAFLIPTGDDPEATEAPQKRQAAKTASPGAPPRNNDGTPTTFPNFGRAKGEPIRDAHPDNLSFYLKAAQKTLADPEKARFHDKERALVAAYEAEIARQMKAAEVAPPPSNAAPDAFAWARENLPRAATIEGVDKILTRVEEKVTVVEFAELVGLGRKRKVELAAKALTDGPPPGFDEAGEPGAEG